MTGAYGRFVTILGRGHSMGGQLQRGMVSQSAGERLLPKDQKLGCEVMRATDGLLLFREDSRATEPWNLGYKPTRNRL